MEFADYMKIKKRMTKAENLNCNISCFKCPLCKEIDGKTAHCVELEQFYPEKAEEIVKRWAEEHPVKSRQQALLEMFPTWWTSAFTEVIATCPQQAEQSFKCLASSGTKSCQQCQKDYWLGEYEEPKKGEDK